MIWVNVPAAMKDIPLMKKMELVNLIETHLLRLEVMDGIQSLDAKCMTSMEIVLSAVSDIGWMQMEIAIKLMTTARIGTKQMETVPIAILATRSSMVTAREMRKNKSPQLEEIMFLKDATLMTMKIKNAWNAVSVGTMMKLLIHASP